jgi:hypothetical protein
LLIGINHKPLGLGDKNKALDSANLDEQTLAFALEAAKIGRA